MPTPKQDTTKTDFLRICSCVQLFGDFLFLLVIRTYWLGIMRDQICASAIIILLQLPCVIETIIMSLTSFKKKLNFNCLPIKYSLDWKTNAAWLPTSWGHGFSLLATLMPVLFQGALSKSFKRKLRQQSQKIPFGCSIGSGSSQLNRNYSLLWSVRHH